MSKVVIVLLLVSLSSLAYVLLQGTSFGLDSDAAEMQKKIKELKTALIEIEDKYKNIKEKYESLESSVPVPVGEELANMKYKLIELDNAVSDHSDLISKVDPTGIIEDTELWLQESYSNVFDSEENGWSRLNSAEFLKRFNRFDDKAKEQVSSVYLNAGRDHLKAKALGLIADDLPEDLVVPVLDNLKRITDGEFQNGWLRGESIRALKDYADDPQVREVLQNIAENDPSDRLASYAAELLGYEIAE